MRLQKKRDCQQAWAVLLLAASSCTQFASYKVLTEISAMLYRNNCKAYKIR